MVVARNPTTVIAHVNTAAIANVGTVAIDHKVPAGTTLVLPVVTALAMQAGTGDRVVATTSHSLPSTTAVVETRVTAPIRVVDTTTATNQLVEITEPLIRVMSTAGMSTAMKMATTWHQTKHLVPKGMEITRTTAPTCKGETRNRLSPRAS